jgi:lipopolysaccharide transport system ATP-binding protein
MKTGTVLFVSHDTVAVVNLCNKAILLNHGQLAEAGTPNDVIKHYLAAFYESNQQVDGILTIDPPISVNKSADLIEYRDMRETLINASSLRNDIEVFQFKSDQDGFGTGDAKIVLVRLLDQSGAPLSWIVGGEDVILEIRCLANKKLQSPIIGFQFKDRLGQVVFADNTFLVYQNNPLVVEAGSEVMARFEFRLPVLPSGDYSISPAIAAGTQDEHVQHHWLHDALIVCVHSSSVCFGLIGVPMKKISLAKK